MGNICVILTCIVTLILMLSFDLWVGIFGGTKGNEYCLIHASTMSIGSSRVAILLMQFMQDCINVQVVPHIVTEQLLPCRTGGIHM